MRNRAILAPFVDAAHIETLISVRRKPCKSVCSTLQGFSFGTIHFPKRPWRTANLQERTRQEKEWAAQFPRIQTPT